MSDTTRYVLFDLETRDVKGIVRNKPLLGENYFEVELYCQFLCYTLFQNLQYIILMIHLLLHTISYL